MPPPPTAPAEAPPADTSTTSAEDVSSAAQALEDELRQAREERGRLASELAARNEEITSLEEAMASLELELGIALEELIRSRANIKNVQSRALAVSRIAEVRVELETFRGKNDPALNDRLERAGAFLDRADETLDEDNWGGAAFLAERAGELVRQAKTIAELRKREPNGLLPIVPPRTMRARAAANLREGPGTDEERLSTVDAGAELEAVGRLGEWFQVVLPGGEGKAWVHRSVVE